MERNQLVDTNEAICSQSCCKGVIKLRFECIYENSNITVNKIELYGCGCEIEFVDDDEFDNVVINKDNYCKKYYFCYVFLNGKSI